MSKDNKVEVPVVRVESMGDRRYGTNFPIQAMNAETAAPEARVLSEDGQTLMEIKADNPGGFATVEGFQIIITGHTDCEINRALIDQFTAQGYAVEMARGAGHRTGKSHFWNELCVKYHEAMHNAAYWDMVQNEDLTPNEKRLKGLEQARGNKQKRKWGNSRGRR